MPDYAITLIAGYLLGSIPFGLILTRLAGLGDIRSIGSGNIGATNVLRTGNKALAAATLLLDGGKGAAAAILGTLYAGTDAGYLASLAAVIGHDFPVWLRFKGGKGVATTLGVLLGAMWPVGAIACATWLAVAGLFRFSSLAALTAFALSPVVAYFVEDVRAAILAAILAVLGIARHHANIRRLLKGEEPRIGGKKV
ncbi:MAG TPA: glycerol-3-phosphate 1-O-acyltransferase PlsY [Magnetospirillaceae bacterium]|jgi:glycerol-3-phosphate acyltransferase PlsY